MFALISIITKLLIKQNLHVFEIVFFQASLGTLIILPWVIKSGFHKARLKSYKIHFARAFLWAVATIFFFYATKLMPIGRAVAISFTVPLFTTILAVVFLKEVLHKRRIIALVVGFIGMLIIIKPGMDAFRPIDLMVVAAAFMWSITDVMIKMVGKVHHAYINTFYFSLFSTFCTLPLALMVWIYPSITQFAWMLLLAILFIINMLAITKSYEYADLTIITPFVFTELIFVVGLEYFIFGDMISLTTLIGSAVIVASISYIAYRERVKNRIS